MDRPPAPGAGFLYRAGTDHHAAARQRRAAPLWRSADGVDRRGGAAVAARRHAGRPVTTASVDELSFLHAANIDDTVVLAARVTYVAAPAWRCAVDTYVERLDGHRDPGQPRLSGDGGAGRKRRAHRSARVWSSRRRRSAPNGPTASGAGSCARSAAPGHKGEKPCFTALRTRTSFPKAAFPTIWTRTPSAITARLKRRWAARERAAAPEALEAAKSSSAWTAGRRALTPVYIHDHEFAALSP